MEEKFKFTLDASEGFLRITLHGKVQRNEIDTVLEAIIEGGVFKQARRLWDVRDSELLLSHAELADIAESAKNQDVPDSRAALVAEKDLHYGLMRIHQVYRESDKISTMVFRDEDEAVRWLLS